MLDGVAAERTNLIASLAADEIKLRPTLAELRQTLDAGTELVKSSDATVQSLDTFMARFNQGTNAPAAPATNAHPFDILEYATTAKEVTATVKELNATISSLDKAVPQIDLAAKKFEAASHRFLTRAFLYAAGLLVLLLLGAFVTATAYRRFITQK
jgi:methyl-accepting chemotaxis protein